MTRLSRFLTVTGLTGALLTGTAFAQTSSSSAMSSHESHHMTSGAMMSHAHGHMSSGAMSPNDRMKAKHSKSDRHGKKKSHHMASGSMSSGH